MFENHPVLASFLIVASVLFLMLYLIVRTIKKAARNALGMSRRGATRITSFIPGRR